MNTIDPMQFAKLMLLPDQARLDLLEFLGATPVADEQLDTLIGHVESQDTNVSTSTLNYNNAKSPAS